MNVELKTYDLIGSRDDEQDMLEEFVSSYSDTMYVGDFISEHADGYVPIYTSDIWKGAYDISEWIEEAQAQGLCEGADMNRQMMSGYYVYYTQSMYENLKELFYNIMATEINDMCNTTQEEEFIKIVDFGEVSEEIESWVEKFDNNDLFSTITGRAREIFADIVDGEYNQE